MLSFTWKRAGGAEGNRTPDLCSAIATSCDQNGEKPGFLPPARERTSAEQIQNPVPFSRTLAGAVFQSSWAL